MSSPWTPFLGDTVEPVVVKSAQQEKKERRELLDEQLALAEKYNAKDRAWSAQQAQKQMDFQERLSSTAHQREVQDLLAAGLNPVLSAGGSGASSPQGASAESASMSALVPDLLNNMNVQAELNYKKEKDAQEHQLDLAKLDLERAKFEAQQQAASAATAAALSKLSSGGSGGARGSGGYRKYSWSGSSGRYWYSDYYRAILDGFLGGDHDAAMEAMMKLGQQGANVAAAFLGTNGERPGYEQIYQDIKNGVASAKSWASQKILEARIKSKNRQRDRQEDQPMRNIPGMYDITHPFRKLY